MGVEPSVTASVVASVLLALAVLGLCSIALQVVLLARHLRTAPPRARHCPGISVLKPLCGVDDDLARNLESFAALDYAPYEVLLGVKDTRDAAYPIALAAAARWPSVMRVVLQRGEPGLNPKVNQLITLAAQARHDLLVVSDSNVAATPDYLADIAGYLDRPEVGLVTHPIAGTGERTLGAFMDNAHLSAGIAPGMVAAKLLLDFPIVVGKSMALRRRDLDALGGFWSAKDVLAEDFVIGRRIPRELGKEVIVAHRPITGVSRARSLGGFVDRYARWGTIQRKSVGGAVYVALLLQHPLAFAALAALLDPSARTCVSLLACWVAKALLEHQALRRLRGRGLGLHMALAVPLKDALLLLSWVIGLVRSHVVWRGTRLDVVEGTRLVPTATPLSALGARGAVLDQDAHVTGS